MFVPPDVSSAAQTVWGQTHLLRDAAASQPCCMTTVRQAINILCNKSTLVPPAASPIKSFTPPARDILTLERRPLRESFNEGWRLRRS